MEVRNYLRDQAGSRSLVFDLSIAHNRFGSSRHVQQNGSLSYPQDLDCPMRVAEQRNTNDYKETYADNQNISFLPAIMITSNHMHCEFLRLLFLQDHRETETHLMPLECHCNTINCPGGCCLSARPAEQGGQRCPGRQQTWCWSCRRQRDG